MYEYYATLLRAIDGDTVELLVDLGFKISKRETIRLLGIDTAEKTSHDRETARVALELMSRLEDLCKNEPLLLQTRKDRREKYGRMLGTLIRISDGVNINELMLTYPGVVKIVGNGVKHAPNK